MNKEGIPKGKLYWTRKDHRDSGSSSGIPEQFEDDVPYWKVLLGLYGPDGLVEYYDDQLSGVKALVELPENIKNDLIERTYLVKKFRDDLRLLEEQGIDVREAREIISLLLS